MPHGQKPTLVAWQQRGVSEPGAVASQSRSVPEDRRRTGRLRPARGHRTTGPAPPLAPGLPPTIRRHRSIAHPWPSPATRL